MRLYAFQGQHCALAFKDKRFRSLGGHVARVDASSTSTTPAVGFIRPLAMLTILLMRLVLVVVFAGWASAFVYRDTGMVLPPPLGLSYRIRDALHQPDSISSYRAR